MMREDSGEKSRDLSAYSSMPILSLGLPFAERQTTTARAADCRLPTAEVENVL